ncbi:MAG: glucose-1-phosphate thymidylyltransferase [Candidatus Peregrinibacteria bacterium Gr01-1014_25]|nr:MAG: glucose-1-phosphate thymidylyltransferase [Candidatus Peregrinibacteria bacterium Gr01-1014_25]
MRAFILAGGFATRLWPLTEKRAKPLLPLAGVPLLTRLVDAVPPHIPVTVSTNAAFADGFAAWRATMRRPDIDVIIEQTVHEGEKLGALGAVAQWIAATGVDEGLLLLTGDNYLGFRMDDFLAAYDGNVPLLAAHDLGDVARARAFGTVVLDADGRSVRSFEEKPAKPKSSLVNTGCSALPAKTLPLLVEHARKHPDNVGGVFEALLAAGWAVHCFQFHEPWFDIGSFDAYLEATRALVGDAVVGDASAMTGTTCAGSVVLGNASRVSGSSLRNVVLFERCSVEDCVLEDCVVDDDCVLKGIDLRGKMLRAGTVLRD